MPTSSLYQMTERVFALQGLELSDWLLECRFNGTGWNTMLKILDGMDIHVSKNTLKKWARAVVSQQAA